MDKFWSRVIGRCARCCSRAECVKIASGSSGKSANISLPNDVRVVEANPNRHLA